MKIKRVFNARQMKRFKSMTYTFAVLVAINMLANYALSQSEDELTALTFTGPYVWQGVQFDMHRRIERNTGYIDEYSSKETFCTR